MGIKCQVFRECSSLRNRSASVALPDDLEADFFPLPIDIKRAKQVVRGLK